MRTGLRIILAIVLVLAILVVVLTMTPVGWRIAEGIVERSVTDATGLELRVGSLRGNLLSSPSLTDVRLSIPDGPSIATAAEIEADYSLAGLLSKKIIVPSLRLDDVELLFVRGADGELAGWSSMGAGADTGAAPADAGVAWLLDVDADVTEFRIVLIDSVIGSTLDVSGVDARVKGGLDAFESALEGSVRYAHPALAHALEGSFSADVAGGLERIDLNTLLVAANVGEVTGDAILHLPTPDGERPPPRPRLEARFDSSFDLAAVARVVGLADLTGRLTAVGSVGGPFDRIAYAADIESSGLTYAGVAVEDLGASVEGDRRSVDLVSLEARALGGDVRVSGGVEFPAGEMGSEAAAGPPREAGTGSFSANATFAGLDVSRIAALAPEAAHTVSGRLDGRVDVVPSSLDASGLAGDFEVDIAGLALDGSTLGDLRVDGSIADGIVTAKGACCSTAFSARTVLSADGLESADVVVRVADLSGPAAAAGLADLGGEGTIHATIVGAMESLTLDASFPTITIRDVDAGPVTVHASGAGGDYTGTFEAFAGAVRGRGALVDTSRYRASLELVDLDLERVVPDSLREFWELTGTVSASATVEGDVAGAYAIDGTVTDLALGVRGQDMALDAPFEIRVTPDSLRLTDVSVAGSFGSISGGGGFDFDGEIDVSANLEAIDLAAVATLAPQPLAADPRGILDGRCRLRGAVSGPRFRIDVDVRELALAEIELGSVTLLAENDSTDVVFDLLATSSATGSISAQGTVPVLPDSARLLKLDPSREFGASVACEDFVLDGRDWLLPQVRGGKRIVVDGSALLTGCADSLVTVNGRGQFDVLSATFDLIGFSLAEPSEFEITGGSVYVDSLVVDIMRRRVLGGEEGGRIVISGAIGRSEDTRFVVRTEGLRIGQVLRAFMPGRSPIVEGALDLEAAVAGDLADPTVEFIWEMLEPTVFDVGFDRFGGSGTLEHWVVELGETELRAGDDAIVVSGRVPLPERTKRRGGESGRRRGREGDLRRGPSARTYDLRVVAEGFRLNGLRPPHGEVDRLEGELVLDLTVGGPPASPTINGAGALRHGLFRGHRLVEPVSDIEFDVVADGHTIGVSRARGKFGRGRIGLAGFAELGTDGGATTFWTKSTLKSPRIAVEGMFEGTFAGEVVWAGTTERSELSGDIVVEETTITYSVGLEELLSRRPAQIFILRSDDPRANVYLDLDVEIQDKVDVESTRASLDVKGGVHVGGTLLAPAVSGGAYAEGGTIRYLGNEFEIETLNVAYVDPRRRDPYIDLIGTGEVENRSGEEYLVTLRIQGFAFDANYELASVPPLAATDIVALLTFGDTAGTLVSGGRGTGSSSDSFAGLARQAFLGHVFGVAESTLERLLHLDTVAFDEGSIENGSLTNVDVTIGKRIGDRFRVDYTMAVGSFDQQAVELSARLTRHLSLDTRADPEGNHAISLKLRVPFR